MGEVLLAVDGQSSSSAGPSSNPGETGRRVAIKVIRADRFDSQDARARFLQEAQITQTLEHPGIVRLLDQGADGDQLFIVFEAVEGGTLAALITRTGPMAPPDFYTVALPLLEAVAFAHDRGVIHRDLKPENILLDGDGKPKIADFGLAKSETNRGVKTATGIVMGTPQYMAPEVLLGRKAGPPADQYALGLILFEMLAGRPTFEGVEVMSLIRMQVDQAPPRLSDRRMDVPEALEAAVMRSLAKDPGARWPSVRELSTQLVEVAKKVGSRWRPTRRLPAVTVENVGAIGSEPAQTLDSARPAPPSSSVSGLRRTGRSTGRTAIPRPSTGRPTGKSPQIVAEAVPPTGIRALTVPLLVIVVSFFLFGGLWRSLKGPVREYAGVTLEGRWVGSSLRIEWKPSFVARSVSVGVSGSIVTSTAVDHLTLSMAPLDTTTKELVLRLQEGGGWTHDLKVTKPALRWNIRRHPTFTRVQWDPPFVAAEVSMTVASQTYMDRSTAALTVVGTGARRTPGVTLRLATADGRRVSETVVLDSVDLGQLGEELREIRMRFLPRKIASHLAKLAPEDLFSLSFGQLFARDKKPLYEARHGRCDPRVLAGLAVASGVRPALDGWRRNDVPRLLERVSAALAEAEHSDRNVGAAIESIHALANLQTQASILGLPQMEGDDAALRCLFGAGPEGLTWFLGPLVVTDHAKASAPPPRTAVVLGGTTDYVRHRWAARPVADPADRSALLALLPEVDRGLPYAETMVDPDQFVSVRRLRSFTKNATKKSTFAAYSASKDQLLAEEFNTDLDSSNSMIAITCNAVAARLELGPLLKDLEGESRSFLEADVTLVFDATTRTHFDLEFPDSNPAVLCFRIPVQAGHPDDESRYVAVTHRVDGGLLENECRLAFHGARGDALFELKNPTQTQPWWGMPRALVVRGFMGPWKPLATTRWTARPPTPAASPAAPR